MPEVKFGELICDFFVTCGVIRSGDQPVPEFEINWASDFDLVLRRQLLVWTNL